MSSPKRPDGLQPGKATLRLPRWRTLGLLVGLLLFPGLSGCMRDERPAIVLVTLDTVRADRLGVMGYADASTPVLDRLAAEGTLFRRAFASSSLTLPSHATILSGADPLEHGVHDNARFVVPRSLETIPERLGAAGYRTGAFVSAMVLDRSFGLAEGFEIYSDSVDMHEGRRRNAIPTRRAAEVNAAATAWLGGLGDEPFFLWAHYYDVHAPREPPPTHDAMADPYDGELSYVDAQLGRLLESVRVAAGEREVLVLVTADHGESLGEHEEHTHGVLAYDSTLHVPLIVHGPGYLGGEVVDAFAQTADIAPTAFAAAGLGQQPDTRGRNLDWLLREADSVTERRLGYFESHGPVYNMGWAGITGVRDGRWKYTAHPSPEELFETLSDPGETENLASTHRDEAERLHDAFRNMLASGPRYGERSGGTDVPELSGKMLRQLVALGYVGAGEEHQNTGHATRAAKGTNREEAPDPRRFAGLLAWVDSARNLTHQGRLADAIKGLEILAESPVARPLALRTVAPLYELAGRVPEALAARDELYRDGGGMLAGEDLARTLLHSGDAVRALTLITELRSRLGVAADGLGLLEATALDSLGRTAEALAILERKLKTMPQDDGALALRARILAERDGPDVALEGLLRTLEQYAVTGMTETRVQAAELLHHQGRDVEALKLLRTGERDPAPERAAAAMLWLERQEFARAEALLRTLVAEPLGGVAPRERLAELLQEAGRHEEAEVVYTELMAINPDVGMYALQRGLSRSVLGQTDDALVDYETAIAVDPKLPEAYFNRALLLMAAERVPEAVADLLRAVELRPEYRKAHFHLARIYRDHGGGDPMYHAERAAGGGEDSGQAGRASGPAAVK